MGNLPSQLELRDLLRPSTLITLLVTLYGVRVVRRIVKVRRTLAGLGNLPGTRYMYGPYTILGRLLPPIPYIVRSGSQLFRRRHTLHQEYNSDIISSSFLFNSTPAAAFLVIADAAAVKEVTTNRLDYPKPLKMYKTISLFGPNIVATEFDEWKRHRRIAAPSFSEKNNRLVYEETSRIVTELFKYWEANGDSSAGVVKVDNAVELTSKLALMVISAAGFGMRFGWDDGEEPPSGHKMTFQKSLSIVMNSVILRLLLSDRILQLWKRGRDTIVAFKELRAYMAEMIDDRRQSTGEEDRAVKADLFTNLVKETSMDPDEKADNQLSDEELMGNVFIFLFAGHETTANSLGFTLALLATHQDIQEKAFTELRRIVPEGETPTYSHVIKWAYGLAITYESLRMYPPVISFPKYAANDTILTTYSTDGKNTPITIPVPRGTDMMINVAGLHYNPKYWDDPYTFRPERFMGDYNRDAFIPFAGGPRSCIGRRFSEIEAVTFLANLILKYKFEATPLGGGAGAGGGAGESESSEEVKERVLKWRQGSITLGPAKVPLTFTLRYG